MEYSKEINIKGVSATSFSNTGLSLANKLKYMFGSVSTTKENKNN